MGDVAAKNLDQMGRENLERMLNERQRRFAAEYVKNGGNGTKAAEAAGYSARSAHVQATRLLQNDKVQALRRAYTRELYNALGLTPEKIGLELWGIYQRCMQGEEHLSWDSDAHAYVPDGSWVFDAKNALRALELMGKQVGALVERVEVSAPEQPMSLAKMLEAARGVLADAGGAGDTAPGETEREQQ